MRDISKLLTTGLIALGVAGCGGGSGGDSSTAASSPVVIGKTDATTLAPPPEALADKAPMDAQGRRLYAVVLKGDPAVSYKGGVAGLAKTRAGEGQRFNAKSSAVQAYRAHLKARQDSVLQSVGGKAVYNYTVALNGFAARLTQAQADALKGNSQVQLVSPNVMRQPTTDNSPRYIGLYKPNKGFHDAGRFGEGVVVGVLDTGIWPEHPSFADDGSFSAPPPTWNVPLNEPGSCEFGNTAFNPDDAPFECNNKLIAARNYNAAFGGASGLLPGTFDSARDDDGHGSHTAGTAAGNKDVPASIGGEPIGNLTGIAPRAHVAVYKVCHNGNAGGCGTVDIVAAIDQAVFDGVDVINYSIGSSSTFFGAGDDIAFLFAKDAGVHVATSAGNTGPDSSTIGSPAGAHWITAVGASQDNDVKNQGLGISRPNPVKGLYEGVPSGGPVQLEDFGVLSGDLVQPEAANFEGCDPIGVDMSGQIALISRGACSFQQKQLNAEGAGAVMMYVYNNQPEGAITMGGIVSQTVPSFMVENEVGQLWKEQLDRGARVTSRADVNESINKRRTMASFSSRGPNAGIPEILKPDVSAPGVNIQAAVTPFPIDGLYSGGAPGDITGTLSGTSMASPHVAGLFALFVERRDDLSPAETKSLVMSRSRQPIRDTFGGEQDFFDSGSGEARGFNRLGMTFNNDFFDDLAALCGAEEQAGIVDPALCDDLAAAGYSLDPTDYNIASITDPQVVGAGSTTRRLTNITNNPQTITFSLNRVPGFDVMMPSEVTMDPGETVEIPVDYSVNGATPGEWQQGQIGYRNTRGNLQGRIPVLLQADDFAAPGEVSETGAGESGSGSIEVAFGFDGSYEAVANGLAPADREDNNVLDDPLNDFGEALNTCNFDAFPFVCEGITWTTISAPADAAYVRVSLFDDFTDGADDLDLFVYDSALSFIGSSQSGTSEEEVNIPNPTDTVYVVAVHGWQTDGPDANYTLFSWGVPSGSAGNFGAIGPASATSGTTGTVTYDWVGLAADEKYLGEIEHNTNITTTLSTTIVNISTE